MMCTRTTILSIPVKRNPNATPDDVIIQKKFSLHYAQHRLCVFYLSIEGFSGYLHT